MLASSAEATVGARGYSSGAAGGVVEEAPGGQTHQLLRDQSRVPIRQGIAATDVPQQCTRPSVTFAAES